MSFTRFARRKLTLMGIAAITLGSCIGPKTSEPNDFDWPTDPGTSATFLRGKVLDLVTRSPIGGVKVDAGPGFGTTTSGPEGDYSLGEFRGLTAMMLVATAAGYDSTKVLIPMEAGEKNFTVYMRMPAGN